ncbi:MAG: GNAT family N-acetyltransferase [Oceanococcus sp.]
MLVEYLADRTEFAPELAALHLAERGLLRPGQTLEDRIESLNGCLGKEATPSTVVATEGPELIGSALLVTHDMSTRRDLSPWLAGVFVKPSFRKMGVATALIQRVESETLLMEVPQLYLYTDKESSFYSSRGWGVLEVCEYRDLEVTVMFKSITQQFTHDH